MSQLSWDDLFSRLTTSGRLAEASLASYRYVLENFLSYWKEASLLGPSDVEKGHLLEYHRSLRNNPRLSQASAEGRMRVLSALFSWAFRQRLILMNPCQNIKIHRPSRPIQRILTEEEVPLLLAAVEHSRVPYVSCRDLAILELLYGTGMRGGELRGLDLCDLDLADRSLAILRGKGKPRRVPFGDWAFRALAAYLDERPTTTEPALFLSTRQKRMSAQNLTARVRFYGRAIGLVEVTPHTLRRTMATHLLENGANVAEIKTLLGHSQLDSTAIYTKIFPGELIRDHRRAHPRARRKEPQDGV